jgi:hypothetical protein
VVRLANSTNCHPYAALSEASSAPKFFPSDGFELVAENQTEPIRFPTKSPINAHPYFLMRNQCDPESLTPVRRQVDGIRRFNRSQLLIPACSCNADGV